MNTKKCDLIPVINVEQRCNGPTPLIWDQIKGHWSGYFMFLDIELKW